MREGVAGLPHHKTRKPRLPPLPSALIDRVVELTLAEPPGEATHWTGRAMAVSTSRAGQARSVRVAVSAILVGASVGRCATPGAPRPPAARPTQ